MKIKVGDESWPLVPRNEVTIDELGILWAEAGLGIKDVMSGDVPNDPRLVRAFVWLARRRDGEFKLKYGDVDFKYSDFGFEFDPEDAVVEENPTEATQNGNESETSNT